VSGIAGLVRHDDKPLTRDTLVRMGVAMAHRGPRAHGAVVRERVGLVHRALHAFPEEALADQPLACAGVHVVCDARLDDRDALARAFDMTARELSLTSDAGLIARGYVKWGRDVVTHLTGDFAFAITDGRTLFCARDQVGTRPFVYCARPGLFAFASETRALFTLDEVPRELDLARVADYVADGRLEYIDTTCTPFVHVTRLPPAHTLVVENGRVTIARYWSIHDHVRDAPRRITSHVQRESLERFRCVFERAVIDRARGAHAGAMLSGGVDSSSIVAIARDHARDTGAAKLRTYSGVWSTDGGGPDGPFIDDMVAMGGLAATRLVPDDAARRHAAIARVLASCTDLYDVYLATMPITVWSAAACDDVRTVQDGIDGDLVCSPGTSGLRFALAEGRFAYAFDAARGLAAHYDTSFREAFVDEGLRPFVRGDVIARLLPDGVRTTRAERARQASAHKAVSESFLAPAYAGWRESEARLARTLAQPWLAPRRREGRVSPAMLHADRLSWPIIPAACERYDRVASSVGIMPTHPLFDRRLFELLVQTPWTEMFRGGVPKSLLRRALGGKLPQSVQKRVQTPAPYAPFLVAAMRALSPAVEVMVGAPLTRASDVIDVVRIRAAHRRFRAGSDDDAHLLFHAHAVVSFLERFRG
jgi:asparagine synthase (glutamine-hydrolysing)